MSYGSANRRAAQIGLIPIIAAALVCKLAKYVARRLARKHRLQPVPRKPVRRH